MLEYLSTSRRKVLGCNWFINSHGQFYVCEGNAFTLVPLPSKAVTADSYVDNSPCDVSVENHGFLALLDNGQVYAWGGNGMGKLGLGDLTSTNVPTLVPLDDLAVTVSLSASSSAIVTIRGKVWMAGYEITDGSVHRQFFPIPLGEKAIDARCGWSHTMILTTSDKVYLSGVPGDYRVSFRAVVIRDHPKCSPFRAFRLYQTRVAQISVCQNRTLLRLRDGQVLACGDNQHGQLGTGQVLKEAHLVPVRLNEPISQVVAGTSSFFIGRSGRVYTCGSNAFGQLGFRDRVGYRIPTAMNFSGQIVACASGETHVYLLTSNDQLYVCGSKDEYSVALGSTSATSSFIPAVFA